MSAAGGKTQYNITGGTRPGNGTNLFHSFADFGVPTNNIANFRNDSALATSNILGRVTGGNPSNILGTIKTTDFGNANLFLMNPAGIVFGATATLDIAGSVHFTTADYLRMADQSGANTGIFQADTSLPSMLTTAPVVAFGFLGSNSAAIMVQGSTLGVRQGQVLSFVGGNHGFTYSDADTGNRVSVPDGMTMAGARLSTSDGQINIASVASPGEILHSTIEPAPNIAGQTFSSMGTITLSENATINVSGDTAGTVLIRGGQLVIADATISADTGAINGASPAVDINVTGGLMISDTRGSPAITARTTGSGDAGEVRIASASLTATSTSLDPFALIDTHSSDTGRGGNIAITTGGLSVVGDPLGLFFFIDSGITGPGNGGDVTISGRNVNLENTNISTGDFLGRFVGTPSGSGGNLRITADSLTLTTSFIATDAFIARTAQDAGDISIDVQEMNLDVSSITSIGFRRGGSITINSDNLILRGSLIESDTTLLAGGGINISGNVVELKSKDTHSGSQLLSSTTGDGAAGMIRVTARDHVSILGGVDAFQPSGIFTNSFGGSGNLGDAGVIEITTARLEMTGGGRINTSTATNGRGGNVLINTAGSISIFGGQPNDVPSPLFSLGSIHPSGIFTETVGLCSGLCGEAGQVSIMTGSLSLGGGAQINSGTTTTGRGGHISINATGPLSISGTLTDGTPSGIFSRTVDLATGAGGNIDLKADQVALSNGAAVSAQSTSMGEAGNITIQVADSFISNNGIVNTSTTQSAGGNITITAGELVHLDHSNITTNVQGGIGSGGNISIDPPTVILEHSNIIASAIGGNGGNINIVAGVFLVSPDSVIDASSTFGLSGTITIESPITNLSGTLAPLPQGFVQPAAFPGKCAARMQGGQNSSLVVRTSRDRIPPEPGELLLSPLFASTQDASMARRSNDLDALRAGLTGLPVPGGCPS